MNHKTIVITGASDGIGAAAARGLKALGSQVVIVGRSKSKTKAIAQDLKAPFYIADFSKLSEVHALGKKLNHDFPKIDVLVNNAGGIMGERTLTEDHHELTLQVNYLAPFLLTNLLLDNLLAAQATVINTSSIANKLLSKFDIDDLDLTKNYTARKAYGNAKLADILFAKELHRRYHPQGLNTAAFHPGVVATSFSSQTNGLFHLLYHTALKRFLLSPDKGADTLQWLASSKPNIDWESGGYYQKRLLAPMHKLASDPGLATQLWERSLQLVELS